MDVVNDESLDTEAKRKILESWKKDAELLSTAQGENMTGGERPQLQDVSLALQELGPGWLALEVEQVRRRVLIGQDPRARIPVPLLREERQQLCSLESIAVE